MSKKKLTYSVVARNRNSWTQDEDGGNRVYEVTADCGHKHQSIAAAQACMDKLTAWYCNCGERSNAHHRRCSSSTGHTANSTSAKWYHAGVEDSNGNSIEMEDVYPVRDSVRCACGGKHPRHYCQNQEPVEGCTGPHMSVQNCPVHKNA